jgi:Xaa-Pro aminopeptidase
MTEKIADRRSPHDFQRRHDKVRREMERQGVDCLLVPINESFTYLSNVATVGYGAYLLFPRDGDAALFINPVAFWDEDEHGSPAGGVYIGGELREAIQTSTAVGDVRGVLPPLFAPEIGAWLEHRGLATSRVGVVGREFDFPRAGAGLMNAAGLAGIDPQFSSALVAAVPKVEFLDATQVLSTARLVKEPSEVSSLRAAAQLADRCAAAVIDELRRPHVTDADLFGAYANTLFRGGGASSWWFMVGASPSSAPRKLNWHDAPTGGVIAPGDVVLAELLPAWADGYVGHAEICVVRGELANEDTYCRLDRVCGQSLEALLAALKPGVITGEVAAAADAQIEAAGFKRGAPLAYSLGLFGLEPPMIGMPEAPDAPAISLRAGMVLCVIVHVIDPATGATVRTGSTQLITDDGTECLNAAAPRGLVRL